MPGPTAPAANGVRIGPANKVPCAHCGRPNDIRNLSDAHILEAGAQVECDHCHHMSEVVGVTPVTMVAVRQSRKHRGPVRPSAGAQPAQQARTVAPGTVFRRR